MPLGGPEKTQDTVDPSKEAEKQADEYGEVLAQQEGVFNGTQEALNDFKNEITGGDHVSIKTEQGGDVADQNKTETVETKTEAIGKSIFETSNDGCKITLNIPQDHNKPDFQDEFFVPSADYLRNKIKRVDGNGAPEEEGRQVLVNIVQKMRKFNEIDISDRQSQEGVAARQKANEILGDSLTNISNIIGEQKFNDIINQL